MEMNEMLDNERVSAHHGRMDNGRFVDGSRLLFAYNCDRSDASAHVAWHDRSGQSVTVVGRYDVDVGWESSTRAERVDAAMPWVYLVRWDDGFEGGAFEDELTMI
jgi:hypothetical protein